MERNLCGPSLSRNLLASFLAFRASLQAVILGWVSGGYSTVEGPSTRAHALAQDDSGFREFSEDRLKTKKGRSSRIVPEFLWGF